MTNCTTRHRASTSRAAARLSLMAPDGRHGRLARRRRAPYAFADACVAHIQQLRRYARRASMPSSTRHPPGVIRPTSSRARTWASTTPPTRAAALGLLILHGHLFLTSPTSTGLNDLPPLPLRTSGAPPHAPFGFRDGGPPYTHTFTTHLPSSSLNSTPPLAHAWLPAPTTTFSRTQQRATRHHHRARTAIHTLLRAPPPLPHPPCTY